MIPLKLTIKGIYSYIDEQTIDFTKLTDSGLFGIFGSVGSGKSTILEAITYALYYETERLNNKDKRAYNMMNLKSNELLIDFKFYTETVDTIYRFIVKSKRNKNRFEDVSIKDKSTLISENGGEWVPCEKTAEEIIGLSYKNFKRTIIIPQGKFKEFLELGSKDRTEMLNEIFHLQRFDLAPKLGSIKKENDIQLSELSGEMKQYELLNEEELKSLKSTLELDKQQSDKLELLIGKLRKDVDTQIELRQLFERIEKLNSKLKSLNEKKEDFDKRKINLNNYTICVTDFQSDLNTKSRLEKDTAKDKSKLINLIEDIKSNVNKQAEVLSKINSIQKDYDNRELIKNEAEELKTIIATRKLITEKEELSERIIKGDLAVEKKKEEQKASEKKIKDKKEEISTLKKSLDNISDLHAVKSFLEKSSSLSKEAQRNNADLEQNLSKKIEFQKEIKAVILKEFYDDDTTKIELNLKSKISLLEYEKKKTEEVVNHILAQEKLKQWADNLVDGEACPVCGSLHHPQILNIENLQSEIKNIRGRKEKIEAEISVIRQQQSKLIELTANLRNIEDLIKASEQKKTEESQEFESHRNSFSWEKYKGKNLDEILLLIEKNRDTDDKIATIEDNVSREESMLDTIKNDVEKYTKAVDRFKTKEIEKKAEINSNVKSLKIFSIENVKSKTDEYLEELANTKTKLAADVETSFNNLTTKKNNIQGYIERDKGIKDTIESTLKSNQELLKNTEEKLKSALGNSKFETLEEIISILSNEINIVAEGEEINDFYNNVKNTKKELEKSNKDSKGKKFDKEKLQITESDLKAKEIVFKELSGKIGALKNNIIKLEKDLGKKKELENKNENLLKRQENIALLSNLFKAKGFVNYISTVYLQNLSESANERFFKMTKQHLQLEITDGNEFQIRDYLNEGKVRNIKTLSGGQMFQASLSLALALADSVQNQIKANNNFFFLDEGFGSLDDESLHVVFETLKSLKKENRIVGVISHVESLKQEIDVHLQVTKNEELGSLATYSWE
jgi:exonuclease SbcC